MAASRSCLVGDRGGGLPGFASTGKFVPWYLPRVAPLYSPHSCRLCLTSPISPPPPLLSRLPPLSPIPWCPHRSTWRFCLRFLPCRIPPRGTPPLLRRCLPRQCPSCSVACTSVLLLFSLPLSSSLPLPLRSPLTLLCPCSSTLLRLPHPCRPMGSCGRSPHPARPFPRPQPPILPVRTKMLEIGRVGL